MAQVRRLAGLVGLVVQLREVRAGVQRRVSRLRGSKCMCAAGAGECLVPVCAAGCWLLGKVCLLRACHPAAPSTPQPLPFHPCRLSINLEHLQQHDAALEVAEAALADEWVRHGDR